MNMSLCISFFYVIDKLWLLIWRILHERYAPVLSDEKINVRGNLFSESRELDSEYFLLLWQLSSVISIVLS